MTQLEQIRQNLLQASAYQSAIYPYPPAQLKQELNDAWQRYYHLSELADQQRPRPGKKDEMGFVVITALAIAGLATIFGGTWLLGREFNESKRIELLNKCIAEATQSGIPLSKAQTECNKLYAGKGFIDVDLGPGGLNTTLLLAGGLGILGLIMAAKYL